MPIDVRADTEVGGRVGGQEANKEFTWTRHRHAHGWKKKGDVQRRGTGSNADTRTVGKRVRQQ